MKTKILRKTVVGVFVLMGLVMLVAAGTRDGRGLVGVGNRMPPTIIVVTNTNDSGPGSLRNALAVANDGDTIDATGVSGTILLTSGELPINHNVTINGPGAGNLAVNGNGAFRVFENFASDVTISGFTVTNGLAADGGGGGILNWGGLKVSDSSIVSNAGGGVGNDAMGIDNQPSNAIATLTITNSTISGNSGSYGGGIFNKNYEGYAAVTVINCTISGNSGSYGGGIENEAFGPESGATSVVTVSNSTLSGNTVAGDGGAIYNTGGFINASASLKVNNSTISGNSATGNGGGIYLSSGQHGFGHLEIGNTILNAGSSGQNIYSDRGTVTSLGYNLSSDDGGGFLTGPGDQINTDPMLGPLQDNGGPTFTHALLPGSPAIDTGDPNFTPPPFYDQRGPGFARVANGRIDKGSFEVQGPIPQSAFSRKTHGGAGTFDVPLPLGGNVGIECRSGGSTNDYQMIIDFATSVTVQSASVTSGTGSVSSFSVSGPQVTVSLIGVINIQRITITLHNVNDGTRTGDVPVSMDVLIGDTTGNGVVNAGDVSQTKSQIGQPVTMSNFREDVNASGTLTATDVAIVKSDVGTSLLP